MLASVACQLPTEVVCAAFGTKRSHEVVACGGRDNAVHVLPFGDGSRIAKLEGHTTSVTAVAFDPDQKRVVAGSDGGSIRLWDLATEQCIRTFGNGHRTTVTAVDYHSFGEFVATVSEDTHLRIWDIRKKACLQSYKGIPNGLTAVRFNPNGKWVASGCNRGIIRIYDLTNGELIQELPSHEGPINSLRFHPEHLFLAAGGADGAMTLWELDSFNRSFRSEPIPGKSVQQVLFRTEGEKTEVLVASEKMLRSFPFSRMSNRTAVTVETPWQVCSDIVCSSNATEAMTVECRGTAVHFTRLALGKGAPTSPVPAGGNNARPSVVSSPPPLPQPAAHSAGSPFRSPVQVESPRTAARVQTSQPSATGAPPSNFRLNERAANHLIERARTPPSDRRSAIPMIPMSDNAARQPYGAPVMQSVPTNVNDHFSTTEQLLSASPSMVSILQRRLTHLRVVRSTWPTDPRGALRHLHSIAKTETDCGVVVDFLTAMQNQRMKERVSFELLPDFLELLHAATRHQQDPILLAALRIARSMNTKFRAKIDEVLRGAQYRAGGVDLAMEARIDNCKKIQSIFEEILNVASALSIRKDPVGDEARTVLSEITSLKPR